MAHQSARLYVGALGIEHRELVTGGKIDQPSPDVCEQRIREDEDRASLGAVEIVERGIEVALGDGMHDVDFQPKRRGRCLRLRAVGYGIGIARIDQNTDHAGGGNKPCSNCNCFATNVLARKLTPVTLPPGLFMLTTRPNFTGSAPIANTMGMLEVAALAASAAAVAPPVAITVTRRATNSAASAGRRSS